MKSARNDYSENPFFYTEVFEGSPRTIAWDQSTENQKKIFYSLVGLFGDRIDYLFKECTGEDSEYESWVRISGGIYKTDLIHLIEQNEEWFFNDSIFQFCFKNADCKPYVAYDEHGIFFIYDMKECEDLLKKIGLSYSVKELISDKSHWEIRPKDCESKLKRFKKILKDNSVFYDDEAEQGA